MVKKGFVFLEAMVYLATSTILISLLALTLGALYKKSAEYTKMVNRYFDLIMVFDYVVADIQQASANPGCWKKIEKDAIIFQMRDGDCGWSVRNSRLMRDYGMFDVGSSRWQKRKAELVAQKVSQCIIKPTFSDNKLRGCQLKLIMQGDKCLKIESFAATRTGIFL